MSAKKTPTIGVLTSGGDAPGMNAAVRAIVRRARAHDCTVMGILRGYHGLLKGEMRELTASSVSDIIQRGGTVLGTARSQEMRTPEGVAKAAGILKDAGVDALIVIGGDGSLAGASALAKEGINVMGVPGTIDLDVGYSEYTIGFDTAVNTAVEAIDRVRDTSAAHERCSIIEVMGRNAGFIALWSGIASGAESIILPEKYNYDEREIIDEILQSRARGKTHHLVVNAEGIGDSESMARHIEKATGIETRATILGYMQRGGSPTAKDRVCASTMGALAVDAILDGKRNRAIGICGGEYQDIDLDEALAMTHAISEYEYELGISLSNHYDKRRRTNGKSEKVTEPVADDAPSHSRARVTTAKKSSTRTEKSGTARKGSASRTK